MVTDVQRLVQYEDCAASIDALFAEARRCEPDQAFEKFLSFAARFSGLSVYNSMLVRIQRPGAVAVASASKWASIGRSIRPGATPLVLLQTFGPVRFVYEHADTEGQPIDGEEANILFATGACSPVQMDELVAAARGNEVRVTMAERGLLHAGFATQGHTVTAADHQRSKSEPWRWEVVVNSNLDTPSQYATLAHELGHVYCGHVGAHPDGKWSNRIKVSRAVQELEAEAVAWLVCQRNRIQPRSIQYLSTYAQSADLSAVSMYAIYDAANRIESRSAAKKWRRQVRMQQAAAP